MWIPVEEKIAMCVCDVETLKTSLDPNVVIVRKMVSMLFEACKQNKREKKIKRKPN